MRLTSSALYRSDCLSVLERLDSEQFALAYIDPPWPSQSTDAQAFETHARLLSRVLQQVHRLLTEAGVVFLHWRPGAWLHPELLLDQIFQENRFVTEIVWPRASKATSTSRPLIDYDTILLYSKTSTFSYHPQHRPAISAGISRLYKLSDERGSFRLVDLTTQRRAPDTVPTDKNRPQAKAHRSPRGMRGEWMGYTPARGRDWRFSPQVLDELREQGKIYFSPHAEKLPRLKIYRAEESATEVGSIWDDLPSGLRPKDLLPGEAPYPTQKPLALLERIVLMASEPGGFVLDPFSGSGPSLIAAAANGRKWLGCDLSAEACSLALRRLRKLGREPTRDFAFAEQSEIEATTTAVSQGYREIALWASARTAQPQPKFVLGQPVAMEETRFCEFKEVKGAKPLDIIGNTVDEYAVAFLNCEGGRIYWGIRDSDRVVVGVNLGGRADDLRKTVTDKLSKIQPAVASTAYHVQLHPVLECEESTAPLLGLCVVEVVIPAPLGPGPFFTGSGAAYVKTDSGKRKLSGTELVDWLRRRGTL